MSRLGLRRRLLLVVLATVALVIAALVAGFNVLLARTLDGDARDLVRSRAAAQVASLRIDHGRLSVGKAPDGRSSDAYFWVFAGARPPSRRADRTGSHPGRAPRPVGREPAPGTPLLRRAVPRAPHAARAFARGVGARARTGPSTA